MTFPAISLVCLCLYGIFAQESDIWPVREFRGVWVATVFRIDWPLSSTESTSHQKHELDDIVTTAHRLNFNAIVFQVRSVGDAMYNSSMEPWSEFLTGTQGKSPSPFYDPLAYLINAAHKKGIEVHAWFNPYRARAGKSYRTGLAPNNMANKYHQYVYAYGTNLWADPGAVTIQDYTLSVFKDVVSRYDVDGVHMDDYFYPYPVSGQDFPDSHSYNLYKSHGGHLAIADWRRNNVNTLVQTLNTELHKIKPHLKFGIAPFGIWKSRHPSTIHGLSAYSALYADSEKWLKQGWVDYLAPQIYWRIDPPAQSYPVLLEWWLQQNPHHRHIYVGNSASAINTHKWPVSEIINQVRISRNHRNESSLGNIMFSWKYFRMNSHSIADEFHTQLYTTPALPPSMPWLHVPAPTSPSNVQSQGKRISWSAPSSGGTFYWSVYFYSADAYNLIAVLPMSTLHYDVVNDGKYAIRGVNRADTESTEVAITVDVSSTATIVG